MRNRKVISLVTLIMFLLFTLASGLTPALAGEKVPITSGPEKASEKSGGGGSSGGGSSDSEESEGDTAPKIEIPEVRVIEAPEDDGEMTTRDFQWFVHLNDLDINPGKLNRQFESNEFQYAATVYVDEIDVYAKNWNDFLDNDLTNRDNYMQVKSFHNGKRIFKGSEHLGEENEITETVPLKVGKNRIEVKVWCDGDVIDDENTYIIYVTRKQVTLDKNSMILTMVGQPKYLTASVNSTNPSQDFTTSLKWDYVNPSQNKVVMAPVTGDPTKVMLTPKNLGKTRVAVYWEYLKNEELNKIKVADCLVNVGDLDLEVSDPILQKDGKYTATFKYHSDYPINITADESKLVKVGLSGSEMDAVEGVDYEFLTGSIPTLFQTCSAGQYKGWFRIRYLKSAAPISWQVEFDGETWNTPAGSKEAVIKLNKDVLNLYLDQEGVTNPNGTIKAWIEKIESNTVMSTRALPDEITWHISGDGDDVIGIENVIKNGRKCTVKPLKAGQAVIQVRYPGCMTKECTVNVSQLVTGLKVENLIMGVGETKPIQYNIEPQNSTNPVVTFTGYSGDIISVDEDGNVTGNSPGRTTVTVTVTTGEQVQTAECEVTVCNLSLFPNKLVLTKNGFPYSINANVQPSDVLLEWEVKPVGSFPIDVVSIKDIPGPQNQKIIEPSTTFTGQADIVVNIPGTNCEAICRAEVGDIRIEATPSRLKENGKYEATFKYTSYFSEPVTANFSQVYNHENNMQGIKVFKVESGVESEINPNISFNPGENIAFHVRYLHSASPITWKVEKDGATWTAIAGKKDAGITIDPTEMKLYVGREGQISGTKTITATVEEKEIAPRGIGSDIKWDIIGDRGIVDIAPLKGKKCNVTGIEPGTAHVRATFANGEHDTCIVNVYQPINGIEINDLTIPLIENSTFNLQAAVKDGSIDDAEITWALGPDEATDVIGLTADNDKAIIKPKKTGKTKVLVTAKDKNTGETYTDFCYIYVGTVDLFVDRVFNADGTYTATFGYENKYPDGAAVTIDSNEFTGGGEIISGSKPAVFELGKHENVFQVKYANANGPQTWAINLQGSESSTTAGIEENENLGIELDKTYLRLPLKSEGNQEITLEATAKMLSEVVPRSAGFEYPISWSIEGDAVEKVSTSTNHRQITFKAKEAGTATVIASYAGKEAKCEIDVGSLELRVKENKLNPDGTYLATFEYKSSYPEGVNILVGENNKFTGNGQIIGSIPSNFNFTENWVEAFQVKFRQSDGNQVWTVIDNGIDNEGNDILDGAVEYSATAYAIDPENLSLKVNPGIVSLYPESETAITATVEVKEDSTEEVQKKNALQEAPDIQWNIQWNIPEEYQEYVEIVKVSEDRRVCDIKAKKVGWAIVEVSHGTLTEYCYVYVNDIKVQPNEINVKKTAGSQTITASVQYGHEVEIEVGNPELRNVVNAENVPQINWSVDKPGIAEIKVSEDKKTCTVTPQDSGTAIVTATLKGASIPVIERQVAEEPKNIVFIEPSDSCKVTVTGTSSSSSGSSSSKKKRSKPAPAALEKMEALMTVGTDLALLNGEEVQLDSITMLVNNRAMITPDSVLKLMGIAYTYDEEARILTFKQGEKEYKLEMNVPLPEMDTPAMKINGKIVVPIRYIAAFFGAEVYWDSDTRTVQILYDAQQE